MKLPFGLLPGHWGLKGKTRERARIEYEITDPFKREVKLLELEGNDPKKIIELKYKFGRIDEETRDRELLELTGKNDKEKELEYLEIEKRFGKIDEKEYAKRKATINNEPFVELEGYFDQSDGLIFSLDYNNVFVQYLRNNGYTATNDETLIDDWFMDILRQNENLIGIDQNTPVKKNLSDEFTEYS